ncbi:MAG: ABC transporter permease [Puniceicoccaceae bacterium]
MRVENRETSDDPEVAIIQPGEPIWRFHWNEVWQYRYLLKFLVLRDIRLIYKQTILGPVHLFIRPIIMTLVFQLVFSEFGQIPTDGIHPFLFYFANHTLWAFFAGVFTASSNVFSSGKTLMSKVYFPRIIPVFSAVLMNAVTLGIQLLFFLIVFTVFFLNGSTQALSFTSFAALIPILQMGLLAMGAGLIFATLTLRYRDLNSLASVIIQGMMYLSPVIYPLAVVPENYRLYASLNPISSAMELFRYSIFASGTISTELMLTGWFISGILLTLGLVSFNLIQRKFVDVV